MARDIMGPEEEIAYEEAFNRYIKELEAKSGCKIELLDDGRTEITRDNGKGEKFYAETLENPDDERVKDSLDLLTKMYGEDEVDTIETTQSAMIGETVGDKETPDTRLRVMVLQDKDGKVIGTSHHALLESGNKNYMFDGYRVVAGGKKNQDLYLAMLVHDIKKAQLAAKEDTENKKILAGHIVEASGKKEEKPYNNAGLKKAFIETPDGKIVEVPYFQSVLADFWNQKGMPKKGQKPIPEHLMAALFDGRKEMTVDELSDLVFRIMDYDSYQTEGYFKGDQDAFDRHEKILDGDLENLNKFLKSARGGIVKFLSDEEIKTSKREGFKIVEHTAADEKDK